MSKREQQGSYHRDRYPDLTPAVHILTVRVMVLRVVALPDILGDACVRSLPDMHRRHSLPPEPGDQAAAGQAAGRRQVKNGGSVMKKRHVLAVTALAVLMSLLLSACGARSAIMAALPDEAAKQQAAELMAASPSDEVTEDDIAEDLMLFRSVDIDTYEFTEFSVDNGIIVYHDPISTGESLLSIEQKRNGDVVIDILEGDLHDQVTCKSNGDVLLNGKKMTVTSS